MGCFCCHLSHKMCQNVGKKCRVKNACGKKRLLKTVTLAVKMKSPEELKSVYNFQSMKRPVELNSLLLKFFCYITWFVIPPD